MDQQGLKTGGLAAARKGSRNKRVMTRSDQSRSGERMMQELRERQPGGLLVAQHLAHMMLVQALRLHLAEGLGCEVPTRTTNVE